MGLFRRRSRETYNEQLLREAGLADQAAQPQPAEEAPAREEPPPPESFIPRPSVFEEIAGVPRARSIGPDPWDACVSVKAPGFGGGEITFVTLPGGDVIVEEEQGDRNVSPFADAVERKLDPPYRATAKQQTEDVWTVGANNLDVERFAFADGDRLELSQRDGNRELRVDGELRDTRIPTLERAGDAFGPDYYVQADRIDGDYWEVRVSPL